MIQKFQCATNLRKIQAVVELCYVHDLPITMRVGQRVGERLREFEIQYSEQDALLVQWALKRADIDEDTIIS